MVSRADVLRCLEPIWLTHNETASRLRGRIESVVDWAKAKGLFRGDNPAAWKGGLQNLPAAPSKAQKKTHHPSLPYALLPTFFRHLQTMPGVGSQPLQFLILTACRTSKVLGAAWAEMSHLPTHNKNQISTTSSPQAAEHSNETVWTIPQERMKAKIEHRVPLVGAPLDILAGCWRAGPLVFSNTAEGDKPMSNMALAMLLRRTVAAAPELAPMPITVHGFRSTFRNWAAEQTSYPREVCEQALAHQLSNKVESAYLRSDFLDKRRALMADWARFCLSGSRL